MKAKSAAIPTEVFVLRVSLNYSQPLIWREVEVRSGLTLHDLHCVIQCIFDWTNSHMYQFLAPPGGKLTRKALCDAKRYIMPHEEDFGFVEKDDIPAEDTPISTVFTSDCKQINYEYDFGDGWEHLVKLKKRIVADVLNPFPKCLAGQNAAPIDDIGGMYGYYDLLDAMPNPSHEMHEYAMELLGENFDATRFDLGVANRRLSSVFKPARKRAPKSRKKAAKSWGIASNLRISQE